MKALTIRQPWASLIAAGVKTIETRSWSTKYRGPIAIHAGKATPVNVPGWCCYPGDDEDPRWSIVPFDGTDPDAADFDDEPIILPLGAVVATCTLADVVPIVEDSDMSALAPYVRVMRDTRLALRRTDVPSWPEDITNQLPFGDFTPGRYAWLLTDITPTTVRCPICRDNATGRERAWHQTHSGGICDAAHGSCFTPWCRCRCHVEARCPVCRGDGRCDPVPAKGRQGLWDWEAS
ncbi:MAG: ASCH domain-containing protein [Acidimicrobiales bacterium]|nr:ASCH domain-containing protein [Acidimicrobiales bacterium]